MGFQTLQNNYFASEFGKSFVSSKEQLNKKNSNNKNVVTKPKNNLKEPIQFFKKIADSDKTSLNSSFLNQKRKPLNNNSNVIIISGSFLNSVYEGFQWNSNKWNTEAWNCDVSIASIFSQQHLPEDIKKQNSITQFPNSDICFGKCKPKPFNIKIENLKNEENKVKRLFFRRSISFKYITFKSIDNLKCFNIPMSELMKISKPVSYKCFPSTGSNVN